jgi:DNA repair protein RAD5
MTAKFFFDKRAAVNSCPDNPLTTQIMMEDLNETNCFVLTGSDAIIKFNNSVKNEYEKISLASFHSIYQPIYYQFKNKTIPTNVLIFRINVIDFLSYTSGDYTKIPSCDFLHLLAYFHSKYQLASIVKNPDKKIELDSTFTNVKQIQMTESSFTKFVSEIVTMPLVNDVLAKIVDAKLDEFKIKLKINLFDYQKKTIKWMYEREKNPIVFDMIMSNKIKLSDTCVVDFTNKRICSQANTNYLIAGGALIDEMGLGKTIQTIVASLLNTKSDWKLDQENKCIESKATLVFCPNTICKQWKREIEKFVKECKIIILATKLCFDKYSLLDLLEADFVIVSYNFVINDAFVNCVSEIIPTNNYGGKTCKTHDKQIEFNKLNKYNKTELLKQTNFNLLLIKWHRIVLDEFHEKNKRSVNKIFNTIMTKWESTYKWCLTGTPFTNASSLSNLFNELTNFASPIDEFGISHPIISDYLKTKCFYRNTKTSIANEYSFTQIKNNNVFIDFATNEQLVYNAYTLDKSNLETDLVLRKLCSCPKMCDIIKSLGKCTTVDDVQNRLMKNHDLEYVRCKKTKRKNKKQLKKWKKITKKYKMPSKEIKYKSIIDKSNTLNMPIDQFVLTKLENIKQQYIVSKTKYNAIKRVRLFYKNAIAKTQNIENEECGICLGNIEKNNVGLTMCGHIFCHDCLTQSFKINKNCPYCAKKLGQDEIFHLDMKINESINNSNKTTTETKDNKYELANLITESGTKIGNIIHYIKNKKNKMILFSQWTDVLKYIQFELNKCGIVSKIAMGNVASCDKAIRDFDSDSDIRIMLLSSDKAASGTNLISANEVIFVDPVYGTKEYCKNIENQAIGRINRIGQTQDIVITRFIINNSVEHKIFKEVYE